jgi:hypothetical protein
MVGSDSKCKTKLTAQNQCNHQTKSKPSGFTVNYTQARLQKVLFLLKTTLKPPKTKMRYGIKPKPICA